MRFNLCCCVQVKETHKTKQHAFMALQDFSRVHHCQGCYVGGRGSSPIQKIMHTLDPNEEQGGQSSHDKTSNRASIKKQSGNMLKRKTSKK